MYRGPRTSRYIKDQGDFVVLDLDFYLPIMRFSIFINVADRFSIRVAFPRSDII